LAMQVPLNKPLRKSLQDTMLQ